MDCVLIDDHPLFRKALRRMLWELSHECLVHEARDVAGALALLESVSCPDLVLYDWRLPDGGGLRGLLAIVQMVPESPVVVVSSNEDPDVIASALTAGARGYIPKSASSGVISSALHLVLAGETYVPSAALGQQTHAVNPGSPGKGLLTARQAEVLSLLAEGYSNKRIAQTLSISEATVRVHVSDILHQLHAENRTEAVAKARRLGLLQSPSTHPH
ncbi:MAG TPA: response regulator transcription factor [Thiotrichales bacterium]|nr:response regulator transcription factor [Thiotrichales bacterium]